MAWLAASPPCAMTTMCDASTPVIISMLSWSKSRSPTPSSGKKSSRLDRLRVTSANWSAGMVSVRDMNASARMSLMRLICWSCDAVSMPSMAMPLRSRVSRLGNCAMTCARSAREGFALAAHNKSDAVDLSMAMMSGLPSNLMLATASTSAQTLNRKSRMSSRTGMSLSCLRSSIVY